MKRETPVRAAILAALSIALAVWATIGPTLADLVVHHKPRGGRRPVSGRETYPSQRIFYP
jgi:hypothetical protein